MRGAYRVRPSKDDGMLFGTGGASGTVLGHAIRPDRELNVEDTACVDIGT